MDNDQLLFSFHRFCRFSLSPRYAIEGRKRIVNSKWFCTRASNPTIPTDTSFSSSIDRPRRPRSYIYYYYHEWTNEKKEWKGKGNRIEPTTVREPTTFDIQERGTRVSARPNTSRAMTPLDCVARITRRSRPPPIDIFHFLLHLSLENGTFRKGLKRMIFFIYRIPGYEDSVTCKKKKKKMAGISFYFVCEEYQQFFDFFESIVALFFQIFLILITFKKLLRKFLSNTRIGIWKY